MEYEQKFEAFSKTVLEEAAMKKQRLLSEVAEQISQAKNKIKLDILKNVESKLRVETEQAEKYKNEVISRTTLEIKRQMVEKRKELIDEMKSSIQKKLINFMDSDKYETWLLLQINDAKHQLNDKNVVVYIGAKDKKFRDNIISKANVKEVNIDENIIYGGCKIISIQNKMLVDNTFYNKLEEAFSNFHELKL